MITISDYGDEYYFGGSDGMDIRVGKFVGGCSDKTDIEEIAKLKEEAELYSMASIYKEALIKCLDLNPVTIAHPADKILYIMKTIIREALERKPEYVEEV